MCFQDEVMHFHSLYHVTLSGAVVMLNVTAIEQVFQVKYIDLLLDPVLK